MTLGHKRQTTVAVVVTCLLGAANVWFFLSRGMEDSYYPTSYATIYYPTDRPVIGDWQEVEGGIEAVVDWDAPVEGWLILKDSVSYSQNDGSNPFFPVFEDDDGFHNYTAIPQPADLSEPLWVRLHQQPH